MCPGLQGRGTVNVNGSKLHLNWDRWMLNNLTEGRRQWLPCATDFNMPPIKQEFNPCHRFYRAIFLRQPRRFRQSKQQSHEQTRVIPASPVQCALLPVRRGATGKAPEVSRPWRWYSFAAAIHTAEPGALVLQVAQRLASGPC